LSNQSEEEGFADLDLGRRAELLRRLEGKLKTDGPATGLLLLGKMVGQLSAEQAAALLDAPPGGKLENKEARRFLSERLASVDPQRALELGKRLLDAEVLAASVGALGEKSAAKAIEVIASLPQEDRISATVWNEFLRRSNGGGLEGSLGGGIEEVMGVLKKSPFLLSQDLLSFGGQGSGFLGAILAQAAMADPSEIPSKVQKLAAELSSLIKATDEDRISPETLSGGIFDKVLNEMRAHDSRAASALFDAIPEASKSDWMYAWEAISRFKNEGADAAIKLAEKCSNEETISKAAGGIWWELAEQNRKAALEWIENLPQGPFKKGVLWAVQMDATFRTGGSDKEAPIKAGDGLLSKESKMDYYTLLFRDMGMADRLEWVEKTSLTSEEKLELFRRVAPIKATN
jgi:hypothetical protein